jgi:integrase
MGGIRVSGVKPRSQTSIEIEFRYRGVRCRETVSLPPTPANIKHCVRLKATVEHEIATGVFDYAKRFPDSKRARVFARIPGAAVTVAENLRKWHDSIKRSVQQETWDEYGLDITRRLIPAFGDKRLTELTRRDVLTWAAGLTCGLKHINNTLIPLRRMLTQALNDELIERNPIQDLEIEIAEQLKTKEPVDPLEPAEVTAVIEQCAPQIANLVQFWAWSGLRTGEIIGLQWADIDWRKGEIRVQRAVRSKRIKVPKTESGRREVKLLAPAREALERQKQHSLLAGGTVFLDPRTGVAWVGDNAIRTTVWRRALAAAKVRYRGPNQLRHTYASWMLSAGEQPMWVARQMGHKDWGMIRKVYGRWIPSVDPDAGSRAVEKITGEAPKATVQPQPAKKSF